MMHVMLVEDDEFKASDISRVVSDVLSSSVISRAASVNSALKAITEAPPTLMLLDMSLPTFDLTAPGGGGSPQSQGGLEVLRLSKRLKHDTNFIIITQYPGIEIDGVEIALSDASQILSKKFSIRVLVCVGYDFESDDWRTTLTSSLTENFGGAS